MKKITPSRLTAMALAIGSVTAVSTPVYSQQATLEEVTVTAQRRAENLQQVPVSITSISQDQLEFQQVTNVADIQMLVPNINLATNTGLANGARVFIRGIGEDDSRVTVDPAVAMYLDNIYIGRQIGALFDLVDVEQVEVLRGPQGTLYGRNSNGGAIKINSVKPNTEENALQIRGTVGNEGRQDVRISGNLAINSQTALQMAVLDRQRGGLYTVQSNGQSVGEWNSTAYRLAGLFRTDSGVEFLLSYDNLSDDSDPLPATIPEDIEKAAGRDGNIFTIEDDMFTPPSPFLSADSTRYTSEADQDGLSLSINGDWQDYTLSSLTSKRTLENDMVSLINVQYDHVVDQEQLSQEFQVTSNYDGPFNFIAGVFYYKEEVTQNYNYFGVNYDIDAQTEALALYSQGSYDFSDQLRLTAGIRFTDEDKDIVSVRSGAINAAMQGSENFTNTDFKLALDYNINDDVMVFGSVTSGFKSGGWSPDNFVTVKEEAVLAYEAGVKSEWLERSVRLNVTAFFNDYEDMQLNGTTSIGFTRFNVPETETYGLEVDVSWAVTEAFNVYSNVGYLQGEYTKVDAASLMGIGDKDNELKNSPEYSVTIGGRYVFDLGDNGLLTAGMDIAYEDESYNLVSNPEHVKREETTLVNARVAWDSPNQQWQVTAWAKNLTDEIYYPASGSVPWLDTVYAADPKTCGIDVRYQL